MRTADFEYVLPADRIAQRPARPRDASRLLRLSRATGALRHHVFRELPELLDPADLLVLNRTRVIPARLPARKLPGGGRAELLLLRRLDDRRWEAMVGGKGLSPGRRLELANGAQAEVEADLGGVRRVLRFEAAVEPHLQRLGEMPLPPYIHTPLSDPDEYQTVFAHEPGSAAAPTAGLHFTPDLLAALAARGLAQAWVTLHIGLDTFAPVNEDDPRRHAIHSEWCAVPPETAAAVAAARARGGRVVAVGTTAVRALESTARGLPPGSPPQPFEGPTDLYILPGHRFRVVDVLLTNFHLPRSTLLMLVCAFAGRETVLSAYEAAIQAGYRFYSFGDAMLIE